ncbi:MAG: TolC family protein [Candidatus Zixiibacteriota bacterium]
MKNRQRIFGLLLYMVGFYLLMLGVSGNSFGQDASGLVTLEDYIALARQNNSEIRAAFENWQAKRYRAGYAGALPNPELSFGHFVEPIQTRVGPQENRFGIRQSLPWFGTLGAKKDMAKFDAARQEQSYEAAYLRVVFNVKRAYYDYYLLGREIELTDANIALLKYWEAVIETRYTTGKASQSDFIQTQIKRSLLENRRDELLDGIEPMRQRIRSLLNIETSDSLPFPTQVDDVDFAITFDTAWAAVSKNNPDINAALAMIEASRAQGRLAGKASLPNMMVGVDYLQTGPAIDPTMPGSGTDPWSINVGLSLPIWLGANKAKKNEARASLHAAQQQHIGEQNRVRTEVANIYGDIESARRTVELYRETIIPQTRQLLDVVFAGYESGSEDIQALLSAQRQLLEAQFAYEEARVKLAVSIAMMESLMGGHKVMSIQTRSEQ